MKIVYSYTDSGGDTLNLMDIGLRGALGIHTDAEVVVLNRQAVTALQTFLAEWQERTTPAPATLTGLIGQRSPVYPIPAPEPLCHRVIPAEAHAASRCTFCGHLWTMHRLADPEPHDVGHPEDPETTREVRVPRQLTGCECGHRWGVHGGSACHAYGCGCTEALLADGKAPYSGGCECTHAYADHDVCGCLKCECGQYRIPS
jgi:hypothetical protein